MKAVSAHHFVASPTVGAKMGPPFLCRLPTTTRLLRTAGVLQSSLHVAAARSSTPAPPVADGGEDQPKPKRKYTRRKSVAPGTEESGTPAPADPPKRKGRAKSKAPAILSLPDSHLPWAGQGGQVELEGVVSSRAAARTTESKPEEEQPKKRTSRRRLQRGSAAFEGDQLAKSVMEQTIKSDEAGNAYINRATFGNGEMQWYGIGVVVGKEKKFKEILEQRMEATPLATDDLTGELQPKPEMEVLVPTRKVTSKSASGRKTSRTIKYMDGGLVFLRCILTNDLIDFVQELPYFRSWRDEVTWAYPDQGTLVLPQPASKEAMDSLNQWMYGEVAPEDLPQVDEEAAKMDPGAPTELNEQGNAIIQREFTGSYTNPSAWFDGSSSQGEAGVSPPKRGRGRTPAAATPSTEPADAPSASQRRSGRASSGSTPAQPPPPQLQQGPYPGAPSWDDARALDEEQSLQLAERYFGSQKKMEAQGAGGSRGGFLEGRRQRPSARDAPPYPDTSNNSGLLDMGMNDDDSLFSGDYGIDDDDQLMGFDDLDDDFGMMSSMPPPRGNDRWTGGPSAARSSRSSPPKQQARGGSQDDWMFDDFGRGEFGDASDGGGRGQPAMAGGRQAPWGPGGGGRQAGPPPTYRLDHRQRGARQASQGRGSSGSSGYIDDELDMGPEQGGYLQQPGRRGGSGSGDDDMFGGLDFDIMDFDDDLDAIDMSDEDLMGITGRPDDFGDGGLGGAPMWGGAPQQQRGSRGDRSGGYQSYDASPSGRGPSRGRGGQSQGGYGGRSSSFGRYNNNNRGRGRGYTGREKSGYGR
uniref:NusG-like N-terminal domain-containing protein n=1 Tax=Dunaliella tertiolecta TaxID=3047 RepID=A0A6S8P647_DUNTE